MAAASNLLAIVLVALLAVALWAAVRRAITGTGVGARPGHVSAPAPTPVRRALRAEAAAASAGLAAGLGAAAIVCLVGGWWPQGYGLPYALAGSIGAVAGLLVHTLLPRPSWPASGDGRVVAELSPRGPTSFARQWVFVLPLASSCVLVLGMLLAGLASATDENGLHRVFQRRGLSGWGVEDGGVVDVQYGVSSSGPFPGWYYGVPVLVGTILLVAVVYWSLRRVAHAPRPASADLFPGDTVLRSLRTQFVMAASSSALAFQIAGLSAITGSVLLGSYLDSVPTADLDAVPGTVPVEPGHTLALVLLLSAVAVAVAALVLLAKSIAIVADLWTAASERGERVEPVGPVEHRSTR